MYPLPLRLGTDDFCHTTTMFQVISPVLFLLPFHKSYQTV